MKKTIFVALILLCVFAIAVPVGAAKPVTPPTGAHYTLNIIGVPRGKNPDMNGNNGHRIFVNLQGGTKIYLIEAKEPDQFAVLDANGTDGRAEFMLPMPAECFATDVAGVITYADTCTVSYTVWARALGKPNGTASMKTCVEDPDQLGTYICSIGSYTLNLQRKNGRSAWENVTEELLFVSADFDTDGATEHLQIFDPMFETYFWQYDNAGLKLLQLRFYMGEYTVKW